MQKGGVKKYFGKGNFLFYDSLVCCLAVFRCPGWCDRILMNEAGLKMVVEVGKGGKGR